MKLATFNINGIRSRLPALLAWLEREAPDVVCLQELKAPDAGFPEAEIAPDTVRSGMDRRRGTASRFSRGTPSRSKRVAVCPETPTIRIAVISRPLSRAC